MEKLIDNVFSQLNPSQLEEIKYILSEATQHMWFIPGEIYLILENCLQSVQLSHILQVKQFKAGRRKTTPHSSIAGMGVTGSWSGLGGAIRLATDSRNEMSDLDYFVFCRPDQTNLIGTEEIDGAIRNGLKGSMLNWTCQNVNASNDTCQLRVDLNKERALEILDGIANPDLGRLLTSGFIFLYYFSPAVFTDLEMEKQLNSSRELLLETWRTHLLKSDIYEELIQIWIRMRGVKPKHFGLQDSIDNVVHLEPLNLYYAHAGLRSLIGE